MDRVQCRLDPGLDLQIAGACLCQRSSRRSNAPSRKWPDPQVGSIIRKPSSGRSFSAGSSVRSRMCSSTKTGVWSSAYVSFAYCDSSWYRSPRNRVDSDSSCRSWMSAAVVGSVAPELEQFRRPRHRTARPSGARSACRPGPSSRAVCRGTSMASSSHSRSVLSGCFSEERQLRVERLLAAPARPGDPDRLDEPRCPRRSG